jgi:hypothetical protein
MPLNTLLAPFTNPPSDFDELLDCLERQRQLLNVARKVAIGTALAVMATMVVLAAQNVNFQGNDALSIIYAIATLFMLIVVAGYRRMLGFAAALEEPKFLGQIALALRERKRRVVREMVGAAEKVLLKTTPEDVAQMPEEEKSAVFDLAYQLKSTEALSRLVWIVREIGGKESLAPLDDLSARAEKRGNKSTAWEELAGLCKLASADVRMRLAKGIIDEREQLNLAQLEASKPKLEAESDQESQQTQS